MILSGGAAGHTLMVGSVIETPTRLTRVADEVLAKLRPGDRVRIDNSWALALQTYQRHQVPPSTDLYGWNQFRDSDGRAIYPQRPVLTGTIVAAQTAGGLPTGRVQGKVLALEALLDIDALPWQADWYRSTVKAAMGSAFEDNFVLWFIDRAQHDNPNSDAAHAYTVSYGGAPNRVCATSRLGSNAAHGPPTRAMTSSIPKSSCRHQRRIAGAFNPSSC